MNAEKANAADVIIVGAGAAGLYCAGTASRRGLSALLLERGASPGRKLAITGKGRCNVTNDCDASQWLANVRGGGKFLFSAARYFAPADAMAFFEELGVPLKTERGGRVFPVSDKASDVVDALIKYASAARIWTGRRVKRVTAENGRVTGVELANGQRLRSRAVVLATGGLSYPVTGSTGDGYDMARSLGHTIAAPQASLVPLHTRERWPARAMGLTLKNVKLTLLDKNGKKLFSEQGEMLFAHFGISGPLALSASAYVRGNASDYSVSIDLKPALDAEKLDSRLLRDFAQQKNRDFSNSLAGLLPKKLIEPVVELSGIPPGTKVNLITRGQRGELVRLLKSLPLHISGLGPLEQAVITAGGVKLGEVNPSTMESRLVNGLYFAGELLDLDAFTGGYNLQIAWSTAHAAATHIPLSNKEESE